MMGDWPNSSDIEILCEKAAGFFIYASTVVKFFMSKNRTPAEQLNQIISHPLSTSHEGRSGIDSLYTQVLEEVVDNIDRGDEELYSHFTTVVGTVVLVFNPLSVKALSDLLRMSSITTTLRSLHSLLLVPTNDVSPVHIFHKSFSDFLTDPGRCIDHRFFVNPQNCHAEISHSCLDPMKEKLKKNICELDDHIILSGVEDLADRRKDYIGDALEYACCFWTKHLLRIPGSGPGVKKMQEVIDKFFTTNLLLWIEVLCLVGNLDICAYALNDIEQWYMLVSYIWSSHSGYSSEFRQEFPASG